MCLHPELCVVQKRVDCSHNQIFLDHFSLFYIILYHAHISSERREHPWCLLLLDILVLKLGDCQSYLENGV